MTIENKLITYEMLTSDKEWKYFKRPYSEDLLGSLKFLDSFGRIRNVKVQDYGVIKQLEEFPRD